MLLLQRCSERSGLQHDARGPSQVIQPGHENIFSKTSGLLFLSTAVGVYLPGFPDIVRCVCLPNEEAFYG
jgi:hypothetical protein